MDVIAAILARHSVRDFSPKPVPKDIVMKILETAARSPSENELYVIATVPVGEKVELIDWPGTADSMGRVKIPPPARDVLNCFVQSFAQFAVPEMVVNEPDPPPEAPP